ncbi:hypothetical protein DES52_10225 [Deinococcus yavapaiensis KR-236]|uniref:Uncharacterized protein n=1 Tax=Deinococcus yavapaiensis KR-236 TaxID=694435 RepID=A0A318SAS2_9DEIO|nr:hypothetical protein DES52_10225 [Deinococcus yavapaiensis KR-236]
MSWQEFQAQRTAFLAGNELDQVNLTNARRLYAASLRYQPRDADTLRRSAKPFLLNTQFTHDQQDGRRAVEKAKQAVELNPLDARNQSTYAAALLAQGHVAEAQAPLLAATRLDPYNVSILYDAAAYFERIGQLRRARTFYLRAQHVRPDPLFDRALRRLSAP